MLTKVLEEVAMSPTLPLQELSVQQGRLACEERSNARCEGRLQLYEGQSVGEQSGAN